MTTLYANSNGLEQKFSFDVSIGKDNSRSSLAVAMFMRFTHPSFQLHDSHKKICHNGLSAGVAQS